MSEEKNILASCVISHHAIYKNNEQVFADNTDDVSAFLLNAYTYFNIKYPKFYKMDTLSKLGWLASELLLAGDERGKDFLPEDTGVILCNANASLDTDIKHFNTLQDIASPAIFVYTLPNIMIGEICIRNNFKGENAFFIQEGFDASFMEGYVGNLLDREMMKACVCGWVDLLDKEYKVALFLVAGAAGIPFTKENIEKIFNEGYYTHAG